MKLSEATERGVYKNIEYGKQRPLFKNIRIGTITPTDIDAALEYHNQCFIFVESKSRGAQLQGGQRLFYERLCDNLTQELPTIILVTEHPKGPDDFDLAETIVSEFRFEYMWRTPHMSITCREAINQFIMDKDLN